MQTERHSLNKPFFNFHPKDEKSSSFAKKLMDEMGIFSIEECDAIINVGGDGTILHSFHHLPAKPNFAVRAPTSNSTLFNGHCNIQNAVDLKQAFEEATLYSINPLKAEIELSDGNVITAYAYQDVVARSFNAQAVLSNEKIETIRTKELWAVAGLLQRP